MPYRRKDSPVWWATYTDASGKRVRRSTGTENRKEAKALEAKWKLEVHHQSKWGEQASHTFDELLLQYLQITQDEKRSADRDRRIARHLRPFFSGRTMEDLQAMDIRYYMDWRKQKGVKPSTINREIAFLSAAINYARREWEWDIPNPVSGRKLKEPEGRIRAISEGEAQALLRTADETPKAPHLVDFIRLALNTGCRAGELLGLEWNRVDLGEGLFRLEGEHTKSGRRRSIPMNKAARQAIVNRARFRATHCPGSPWVFCDRTGRRLKSVKRSFKTACLRAGLEDFRIHDMRHTCAAWLVSRGVPLSEIRDLLGHSTVTMTEKYAHLAPENVRAAVEVLDGSVSRFRHAGVALGEVNGL